MQKAHVNINWENYPSDKTAVNEQNLNKMDKAIDAVDDRVIILDTTKLDKTEAQHLVKSIAFDRSTGIFTITYFNGTFDIIDTLLEKIAVNFGYDATTQKLSITLDDGTVEYIDLSALITQYEFLDSDTVVFQVQADGKIKAIVKEGSIEEKHLRPDYLADIRVEVAKAEASKNAAAESEKNAAKSEKNAKGSEENAAVSEANAEKYKTDSETAAQNAKDSEDASKISETNTKASEEAARESEEAAGVSAREAEDSAGAASTSAADAADSAEQAEGFSEMSKSYAVGTDGEVRQDDATDNSKFYSELAQKLTDEAQKLLDQAQKIVAAASAGALVPAGTVAFEDLPDEPKVGYMYNISNDFVTDSRFVEGTGVFYRSGANIYWTKDGQWDVMVGTQVTGIKGSAETEYRIGNVNITKANVGLGNVPDVTTNDQTPTFTQAATRENIASGNKMSVILGKIMKWYSDLKAVAFSGSYNDLSNKPTIPSVGNGTLTIQKNGANVQTFTANQGTNATANITVPTKASDIGAVATTKVLTTKEQIDANTDTGNVAGATAVKSMISEINSNLSKLPKLTLGTVSGVSSVTGHFIIPTLSDGSVPIAAVALSYSAYCNVIITATGAYHAQITSWNDASVPLENIAVTLLVLYARM